MIINNLLFKTAQEITRGIKPAYRLDDSIKSRLKVLIKSGKH